jgi:hypothetical protein
MTSNGHASVSFRFDVDEANLNMSADFREADPAELRLPASRSSGADPYKLQRQIARFGNSTSGMPPLLAYEGSDGLLRLVDGVTRATHVAELLPGVKVKVEVLGKLKQPVGKIRRVGDAS